MENKQPYETNQNQEQEHSLQPPPDPLSKQTPRHAQVIVIGAGIAGSSIIFQKSHTLQ